MAPILEDPRFRHRWNQLSQNAESATETAAANIWSFQHKYMNPCFSSVIFGIEKCVGSCFPHRDERAWRRNRGRAEASFDFYDDWDQEDTSRARGLLGNWGNDELGRLLAGNSSHSNRIDIMNQPSRTKRAMSYGTRGRRKSLDHDPTVIPSTSALGFLGRLPFKLGGTLRYKPSAADLQEHPVKSSTGIKNKHEVKHLITDEEYDYIQNNLDKRNRGTTISSDQRSDSFRSRRDLLPSDEEEDAVPLSDEFTLDVERRNTGFTIEEDIRQARAPKCEQLPSSGNSSIIVSPTPQSTSRSRIFLAGKQEILTDSRSEIGSSGLAMIQTLSTFDLQEEETLEFYKEVEVKEQKKKQKARSF